MELMKFAITNMTFRHRVLTTNNLLTDERHPWIPRMRLQSC